MADLIVRGGRRLSGVFDVPGDKSVSHRALLLASLAAGDTLLLGLSDCIDVRRTLECVRALGVGIDELDPTSVRVHGRGMPLPRGPAVELPCGDSGTTMRLLAGLLAGQGPPFRLTADAGLCRRPMARVVEPLRSMGADLRAGASGRAPLVGRPARLVGREIVLAQASAQVGSAVLLAALRAEGVTTVRYPAPVRDHTERMLAAMGAPVDWAPTTSRLPGPVARLSPVGDGELRLPGDVSAGAFGLVAAALTRDSTVALHGVGVNPGRMGLLEVMEAMGAPVAVLPRADRGGESVADLGATFGSLQALDVGPELVPRAIDELPLVALLATQASGRSTVRGAAELRVKESDRIEATVAGLARMGARIRATPDGFDVEGPTPLVGAALDAREDHRLAMTFAVAGLIAEGETRVSGAERIADSFPGFVDALASIGADVSLAP